MQSFKEIIRQVHWEVVIIHVDILLNTSLLSIYFTMPRIGHLGQAISIFGYLKFHPKSKLDFDLAHPAINENRFKDYDWEGFIGMPEKKYHGTIQCL